MEYKIELYEIRGRKIVDDFIAGLNEETKAKIFWMFEKLEKFGLGIGMPHVKKVHKYLFELRVRK